MNNNDKIVAITKDLVEGKQPGQWLSWLFDIQNSMIATGQMESLTEKGSKDVALQFGKLKNFFVDIDGLNINS